MVIMEQEIWKQYYFKGIGTDYRGSNFGRIKSLKMGKETIMNPQHTSKKYRRASLSINNKQYKVLVHRIIAELFLENPNNYDQVNHKDTNRNNNHWLNLEWCNNA